MASLDSVNLDQVVDYRAEYTAVIQKYKITGDNLVGLCPFHQDRFQSTRPARGATTSARMATTTFLISIHAPREGRDSDPDGALAQAPISIHAPREGRDG